MATPAYLRYLNQNATRNKPLSPALASALGFLPELGITAEVFSGGQDGIGQGDRRTGSVRHDHGDAADVFFTRDGRRLDWANPEDRPLFEEIVRRGKANGLTGFGAGPGYMQAGSMHVGFGSPGVWGAGGRGANAPDWLRAAYGEAPVGEVPVSGGAGQEMAYGGAGEDRLTENPMQNNPGGLGGLGGWRGVVTSDGFGDTLTALGASLMSSPSNNPFEQFSTNLSNAQTVRMRREQLERDRLNEENDRAAFESLLRSQGFNADEARAYSRNSSVASAAITQKRQDAAKAKEEAEKNVTREWIAKNHPDLMDTPIDVAVRIAQERRADMNKPPNLETIYNDQGYEQKGYYDRKTGEWVNVGGAKTASRGTADDRKAMREAEDGVFAADQALSSVKTAQELSPKAYEGYWARSRAWLGNNLPDGVVPDWLADPEGSAATSRLDQATTEGALQQLKSIFGGAPTEGERQILLDIQGASTQPESVRREIYARAEQAIQRRRQFQAERADELRGMTYGAPGATAPAPAVPPIVPGSDADPLGIRR